VNISGQPWRAAFRRPDRARYFLLTLPPSTIPGDFCGKANKVGQIKNNGITLERKRKTRTAHRKIVKIRSQNLVW
jgi:hypothetical protein